MKEADLMSADLPVSHEEAELRDPEVTGSALSEVDQYGCREADPVAIDHDLPNPWGHNDVAMDEPSVSVRKTHFPRQGGWPKQIEVAFDIQGMAIEIDPKT